MLDRIISKRFRGFYPVIIDVETGGVNAETDALLEIAAVFVTCDEQGQLQPDPEIWHQHLMPGEGTKLDEKSLKINKIDPYHPLRFAISEPQAMLDLLQTVSRRKKKFNCKFAVLVGHNAWFDLAFINAAIKRTGLKNRNPFHAFTCFDTATLGVAAYGHTVLAKLAKLAGLEFDSKEHHSAKHDAWVTAELFCKIINLHEWPEV